MLFLWKEASGNKNATEFFQKLEKQLLAIHERLGDRSSFSQDLSGLQKRADEYLSDYSGANGRYRYAKALELGENCSGILMMSLDGDFDEAGWEKLRSFLYYCEV